MRSWSTVGAMYDASPASVSSVEDFWAVIPAGGAGTRLWPLSRAVGAQVPARPDGDGALAAAVHLGPARAAVRRRTSWWSPACCTRTPSARSCRTSSRRTCSPSPRRVTRWRRSAWPLPSWSAAIPARSSAPSPPTTSSATPRPSAAACARRWRWPAPAPSSRSASSPPTRRPGSATSTSASRWQVDGAPHALAVSEFVEKPDAATAGAWLATGSTAGTPGCSSSRPRCCWTCWRRYQPELARGLRALAAEPERLEELWPGLTKIAIDHAVAEPAAADGRVAVVPGDFDWDDVGDFSSLGSLIADSDDAAGGQDPGLARPRPHPRRPRAGRPRVGPHRRRAGAGGRRRGGHPGRGAGDHPGPGPGGQGPRRRAEEQRPRRPHLSRRRWRASAPPVVPRTLGGAGWVVCRSCGPLLAHRRPELDRGRAGAGAGGGTTRPARAPRARPHRDAHDRRSSPATSRPPGSGCARCPARAWSPTSGPGTRRTAWPCARTWTRCRSWTGPACPGPRSTTGSATPAGTTSTPARCSAPGSRCGRTRTRWRDLGVAVRLIFQPAEEVIPGGAHEVVAHGGLDGVDRIFGIHCDPAVDVGHVGLAEGPITAAADSVTVTLSRPRRAHLPAAPDRGPHLRPGQGGHRRAGRPVPPARPTRRGRAGVGQPARRGSPERHPVDRHGQRHAADARRRRLGHDGAPGGGPGRGRRRAVRRLGQGRARARASPRWSTTTSRWRSSPARRARSSARTPSSPTRQSLGGEDFAWYLDGARRDGPARHPDARGPHLRPAPGRPDRR